MPGHEALGNHLDQPGKVHAGIILEVDDYHALVVSGHIPDRERVRRIHQRHPLEINVGAGKLRHDVAHIVIHPVDDRLHNSFFPITPTIGVPVDFLDPLQVDDRCHPYEQVDVAWHIKLLGHNATVQTLVKQQIRLSRQRTPGREIARCVARPDQRKIIIMNILAELPGSGTAIILEQRLQLVDMVRTHGKMVALAILAFRRETCHLGAGVSVKAVAADHRRTEVLAGEDFAEDRTCGGRAGTG